MCACIAVMYITSTLSQEVFIMLSQSATSTVQTTERRKRERSASDGEFQPRSRGEREFGIGYGRSSGYVRNRSYVASQPALFRCR